MLINLDVTCPYCGGRALALRRPGDDDDLHDDLYLEGVCSHLACARLALEDPGAEGPMDTVEIWWAPDLCGLPCWADLGQILYEPPACTTPHYGELVSVDFDDGGQPVIDPWERDRGLVSGDLMFAADPVAFLDEAAAELDGWPDDPELLEPLSATAVQTVARGLRVPAEKVDFLALADALDEAEADPDMIDHCRCWPRHSSGCWVLARVRVAAPSAT